MALWKILTVICAAMIYAEAKWNHHQKREVATSSICDPVYNNTNKVQCYCAKDIRDPDVIRSADCYLSTDGVTEDDVIWNRFKILKTVNKLTVTNSRGISLKYIPTKIFNETVAVQKIDIKHGVIEKVMAFAFANLNKVKEITLRDNQITVLEVNAFAHHRELTAISLDANNLIEINRDVFVDLPALEKLYLTSNKITTIHDKAFVHLTNLRELEIDRNGLFSLNNETFSGLGKLQKLDLSSNSLEVIGDNTFLPLVNLLSLNLEGNKIQMLDDRAFNGLVKLQSLSLARNKLVDIDNVKVFEGLNSLISLSLKGNQLKLLKSEVMAPILTNMYRNVSSLDVEENNFSCSCRLDWFVSLMNKTQNNHLKNAIENLKCLPDASLKDAWAKTEEAEKTTAKIYEDEEPQMSSKDYEYYDDTQLNGRLFYIDVRDLLNCSNSKRPTPNITETTKTIIVTTKVTKATPSPTTVKPKIETTVEITTKLVIDKANDVSKVTVKTDKDYTTAKLVTVSANPIENNIYDQDMASDDPKPDKIKAHRSIQDIEDVPNARPNSALNNVGCLTLILSCLRLSFH